MRVSVYSFALGVLSVALCGCRCGGTPRVADGRHFTVEAFAFEMTPGLVIPSRYFSFEGGIDTYTLRFANRTGLTIQGICYVKTFGGNEPEVRIDVVDGRYIVVPETLPGSEIRSDAFFAMLGRIRSYDLVTGRCVHVGPARRYDHDLPLEYDVRVVTQSPHE